MMSFARYLWDSYSNLVDAQGWWEDSDITKTENKDSRPTSSLSSAEPQHTPERKGVDTEELATEEVSSQKPSEDVSQNDQHQQKDAKPLTTESYRDINSDPIYRDLVAQNQRLQQDNIRHLRWQDEATMAIKNLEEEKESQKREARAAKKAAATAKQAMQREIDELKHQIQESELQKDQVFQENARAAEAYESCLQEVEKGLKAEKEAAGRAAAAAERQMKEVQARHDEQLREANSHIGELKTTQSSSTGSRWEVGLLREQLARAKREGAEALAAKEREIERLQTHVSDRDFEIRCARADAAHDRQAKRQITWEKNDLVHTSTALECQVKKLREEKESLELENKRAESVASGAEGRAQGFQGMLKAAEKRADRWERDCKKAEEDVRNEVLSAYEVVPAQISEYDQRITRLSGEVEESKALVKEVQNENSELRRTIGSFEAVVAKWERTWQEAIEGHKIWEESVAQWKEEVHGQYEKEKR